MDRRIFKTQCNGQTIAADPIAALREITCHKEVNLQADAKLCDLLAVPNADDGLVKEALQAQGRLVGAARKAFGMAPWSVNDEEGFTDAEVWQVFQEFAIWSADVKKNGEVNPTLPNVTERLYSERV